MLITTTHLDTVREAYKAKWSLASLYEQVALHSKRSRYSFEVSVFLSHKHDELTPLQNVIALLNLNGVEVYVDWMDSTMPQQPNSHTAAKLKEKIAECRKFILLATAGAINSKWCNWELGLGDVHKYADHIALLPVASPGGDWPGNEYLQIYPAIMTKYEYLTGDYYVEFKGQKTPLSTWLAS